MELDTQIPKGEDISLRLDTSKKFLKYTIDDETSCFDIFFWKIIDDFCWSRRDYLSWEDFYNYINSKIDKFSYSQNVMNMLYEFINAQTDRLYLKLFSKISTFNIDYTLIRSVLEEIVSRGIYWYKSATAELVYEMYVNDRYTIPGGLCSIFVTVGGGIEGAETLNSTKIMKRINIPSLSSLSNTDISSEEENTDI